MPQAQQDHRVRPASRLASAVRHAKEEQVILKGNPIRTLARILAVISAGAALILLMPAVWLFIAFNNEYRVCVPLENGMNLGYEAVFDLSRPLFKPIAVPRFPDGTPLIRVETWALYVTDTTIYGLTDDRRKRLLAVCARYSVSPYMVMLGAFAVGALVTLSAVLRSEWSRRGALPERR